MRMGQDIPEIAARLDDRVLTIRMNRPQKKNALISPMYWRMAELTSCMSGPLVLAGSSL